MTQRPAAPAPPDRWDLCQNAVLNVGDLLCIDTTEATIPTGSRDWNPHLEAMKRLEAGETVNIDEGRRVGHYWLRAPALAPSAELTAEISAAISETETVARDVLETMRPEYVLHLGIGGSALGPELLRDALGDYSQTAPVKAPNYHVLDNVDPDGLADHIAGVDLQRTLVIVVSKSGGTAEIQQGLRVLETAFALADLQFASHAIAITGRNSKLDQRAQAEGWRARLPIWDFVGGRTSVTGPVGLLPLALLGGDPRAFLAGAAEMDTATRAPAVNNPAIWLAERWLEDQTDKARAMVVLPYSDRLGSFARYLQQLIMESLGKRLNRNGQEVRTALTVYGNKGSTDQHAYVQQLRDGPDDFFATFIEVRQPATTPDDTSDLLYGLLDGTRSALFSDGKSCVTLQLPQLNARTLGGLIALFERAVGLYAEAVNINAYHQPGVEAGKRAAAATISAQKRLLEVVSTEPQNAQTLCEKADLQDIVTAWRLLCRLAQQDRHIARQKGATPRDDQFFTRRPNG